MCYRLGRPRISHRWISPKTHRLLHFDAKALGSALAESAAREAELRIYLSKATLVVLPPTLIEQWKGQISEHFAGDASRWLSPKELHILCTITAIHQFLRTVLFLGYKISWTLINLLLLSVWGILLDWKYVLHDTGDLLRVRIITSPGNYPRNVHELAWNYDLVLTTFSHFSSEWKKGEAPLLQVSILDILASPDSDFKL